MNTDEPTASSAVSPARQAATRIWFAATLAWLAFIAWRTHQGWPKIPLDMGGTDPSTDAAYQAAQLGHVARALGLALGVPALVYVITRLVIRR